MEVGPRTRRRTGFGASGGGAVRELAAGAASALVVGLVLVRTIVLGLAVAQRSRRWAVPSNITSRALVMITIYPWRLCYSGAAGVEVKTSSRLR